jgi:hypothetical protein
MMNVSQSTLEENNQQQLIVQNKYGQNALNGILCLKMCSNGSQEV